jgi:hypothetical protein
MMAGCGFVAVSVSLVTGSVLGLAVVPFYAAGWALGPAESHVLDDPKLEQSRVVHQFVIRAVLPAVIVMALAGSILVSGLSFLFGILLAMGGLGAFGGYATRFGLSHKD